MLEVVADAVAQLRDKLVQNAVDFALPGIVVTISLFQSTKPICIRAGNKGRMLFSEISAGLFSAMVSTRVDSFSNANSAGHLGLGLCLVRLIAEFNHGTVTRTICPMAVACSLRCCWRIRLHKANSPTRVELGCLLCLGLGDDLLSHGYDRTIIGATSFHGPVRDGKGWVQRAMVAKNLVVVRPA